MKIMKFTVALVGFGMLAQSGMQSQAYVLKNPVDLTPTAVQNSGATYGSNVVTHVPQEGYQNSTAMDQPPADGMDFTNTTVTDTTFENQVATEANDSTALIGRPVPARLVRNAVRDDGVSDTVTTTNSSALMADQQAQMAPPSSGAGAWIAALVGLLVVTGLLFAIFKRESETHI
jgi:cobalamin biosynthesis Mg chelatase CobN